MHLRQRNLASTDSNALALDRIPCRNSATSADPSTSAQDLVRILVFRACRGPQFAVAISRVRSLYPGAHLTAVAAPALMADSLAAGADDCLAHEGRRFGVLRTPLSLIRTIRRGRFDAVAVAQMSDDFAGHANVYRLLLALKTPEVLLVPFEQPVQRFSAVAFQRFVWRGSLPAVMRHVDVPLMLGLLLVAAVIGAWRRLAPQPVAPARRRQRVLQVITTLGVGGAQVQLAEFVDRMSSDRFDVDVLVLGRSDGTFSAQRFRRPNLQIKYVEAFPSLSSSILEIAALCRREHYDIVHTWLFYANFIGAAGARLAGVPFVISGVRNLSLWKREWNTKWWYRIADAIAARIPDVLTVNATPLVADHQWWAMTNRAIPVVPNGLNPMHVVAESAGARGWLRRELGLGPDAVIVGTVGRLAHEKDQALFVEAFAAAKRERPELEGVIVGDGECETALKQLARDLGVESSLAFMGRRSDSRRIIAGLDLFVLTSKSEGFPNVLLEAAFLETPAISTDVAGAGDVLDHPGDLFPIGNVDLAAARMARAGSPSSVRRAADVRKRACLLFTSDRMAASWLDHYPARRMEEE